MRPLRESLTALAFQARFVAEDARTLRGGRRLVGAEATAYLAQTLRRLRGAAPMNMNDRDPVGYPMNDGRMVWLRPGSSDAYTYWEVMVHHEYDPPPGPARALAGISELNVVDLGANIGLFTAFAARRFPGCRIDAYEPEPSNLRVLDRNIAGLPGVTLHRAAASTAPGELVFAAGDGPCSGEVFDHADDTAIRVPAEDAMGVIARADLIKMDIEGGEWALLLDPRFTALAARAIVIEYHQMGCPGAAPFTVASARLRAAGFEIGWHTVTSPESGVMWGWR